MVETPMPILPAPVAVSRPVGRRGGTGRRSALLIGIGVALLGAAPTLMVQASGHGRGILPPQHPTANVPARPAFLGVCARAGATGTACARAATLAFDRARGLEGLGPLALPSRFAGLPPAEQLFVLANEERTSRGLAPFVGLTVDLGRRAAAAAAAGNDPTLTSWRLGADGVAAWAGNWASGPTPLGASYAWMYDDGYGTGNLACPTPTASGCWGHRENILVRWTPTPGRWLLMGAASVDRGADSGGAAVLLVLVHGPRPALTYSWTEAVAEGF